MTPRPTTTVVLSPWPPPSPRARHTYSASEVCRATGASYRQLDYWCRSGLVPGQPAGSQTGSGQRRWFDDEQVQRVRLLRLVQRLRTATLYELIELVGERETLEALEARLDGQRKAIGW